MPPLNQLREKGMAMTIVEAARAVTGGVDTHLDVHVAAALDPMGGLLGSVWVNGHEWAKRQVAGAGLSFTELSNGFASCSDPTALQQICDRLGPNQIQSFFERWMQVIPTPLGAADRATGYWWELSMRQIEVSDTIVFDAPRRARAVFEATVADNLDIGRPDEIKLIFNRQIRKNTPSEFATKVVTRGTEVTVNAFYKHSRIKQYLKEGRALRIETVVNSPTDLRCAPPSHPPR